LWHHGKDHRNKPIELIVENALGLLIIGDVHKLIALCQKVDPLMLQRLPQPFAAIQADLNMVMNPLKTMRSKPEMLPLTKSENLSINFFMGHLSCVVDGCFL